jgi:hypothetical protein
VITTTDGRTVRGLVVRETAQEIVLKTREDAEPVTVSPAEVAARTTEPVSIMPPDLPDTVTDAGVRNVTAYLMRTVQ